MFVSDLKHPSLTLEEKLHTLYTLNRDKTIDLSFRPPFLNLLSAFGNPHLNLPPVIHVAGTNGKGSTIAILRSILEAAGYRVHTYTSPHLMKFNERICLAGQNIDDQMLEALIDEAIALNDGAAVTFFEITTAMAFAAFSRTPADICLLETGLGGRLDCTNIIESARATIITTIGRDHSEYLGETIREIAAEKAGIIKDHVPCIIGAQQDNGINSHSVNVFESKALDKNAALFRYGADWLIEPFEAAQTQAQHMRFIYRGEDMILPRPTLRGAHQIQNAGAALAALKLIEQDFPCSNEAYIEGLSAVRWPARLQKLESGKLHDMLPCGWSLYLDGGHNESAGQALAQRAADWQNKSAKKLHLVLGMMQHKEPGRFIKPLMPYLKSLSLIDIAGEPASMSAADLKAELKNVTSDLDIAVQTYASPEAAIGAILDDNRDAGRILITGSLYLAGHILKDIQNK